MQKNKAEDYDELKDIKEDLDSLKTNVVALTQHLKENGLDHMVDLEGRAKKAIKALRAEGGRRYVEIEKRVKEKPGQALLVAFAGGLVASQLLHSHHNHRGR